MTYLTARLKEPTTWRGLVLVATGAGIGVSPEQSDAIVALGLAIAGLIGALTPNDIAQS